MARLPLAEQLKEFTDVRPVDTEIDRESEEGSFASKADAAEARAHYLDVGRSHLRPQNQLTDDPRYADRKVSRKNLHNSDLEDDGDSTSEVDFSNNFEESVTRNECAVPSTSSAAVTSAGIAQEEWGMMQQLKEAVSADVRKGLDVRKQMAFWDTLLEGRIRLQKITSVMNSLPSTTSEAAPPEASAQDVYELLYQLQTLDGLFLELRENLTRGTSSIEAPPRRRQRREDFDVVKASKEAQDLANACTPHLRATINKWSGKVAAASTINRFNDRNIWSQIESILTSDSQRLLARTRKSRTSEATITSSELEDAEVFDDSDFYHQLLREVIENRSLELDDSTLASLRSSEAVRHKNKRTIDIKTSKGRKLRYDVHEKLINFMTPRPQPAPSGSRLWHEEQIDQLFSTLLGSAAASTGPIEDVMVADNNVNGSLAIFG